MLEYDDERSGTFEPLLDLPRDKTAVLGLVTTKWPELEHAEILIARIEEASRYFPKDRLALSPQSGFASEVAGNSLSERHQQAKLTLVADVARQVWG